MDNKEEQRINALINQEVRPLQRRIDHLEKEVRRLKSDLQNTKSILSRIKR